MKIQHRTFRSPHFCHIITTATTSQIQRDEQDDTSTQIHQEKDAQPKGSGGGQHHARRRRQSAHGFCHSQEAGSFLFGSSFEENQFRWHDRILRFEPTACPRVSDEGEGRQEGGSSRLL